MNLQGNGHNHNNRPNLENDNMLFSLNENLDNKKNTDIKPRTNSLNEDTIDNKDDEINISTKAKNNRNMSAYDDLDDYIYTHPKRRSHHSSHSSGNSKGRKVSKHKHHGKKRKLKKWQKVCIGIISAIIGLIIASVVAIIVLVCVGKNSLLNNDNLSIIVPDNAVSSENGMYITYKGVKYKYNENVTSILCMGIDRDTLSNLDGDIGTGGDADSLFVIAIDISNGETKLVNISRDTMTDIGIYSTNNKYIGTKKAQICLAYAYGDGAETSCHNEIVSVRQLLYNIPINSYLALDLQGIGPINDSLGGVTVTSPETIGTFKNGETYILKGSLAQSFVRVRSHATIEGNNLRMQRQKIYLENFGSKLIDLTISTIATPLNVFNTATPYICTNIDASKIAYLSVNAIRGNYEEFEIKTVPGKVKSGERYAEFYVDEDKLFELFLDVYYNPVGNAE